MTQTLPPRRRLPRRAARLVLSALLVLPALALASPPAARADPVACQRTRAELADLSGGVGSQRALGSEIARLEAYRRSLDCAGTQFLFFDTRPPQCAAVEQRIKALQAGYGVENGEVVAARRRQLLAVLAAVCPAQPPPILDAQGVPQTARGGGVVICVKTCDGSYFPMNNLPDGRGGADEMCQALCPGTEAVAYSMPPGDEGLRSAATIRGNRSYVSLKTAFRYRTSFEPSCTCKREGQGWAQSLARAESMLVRHKGDIFVTPMQAEALSRAPKVRLTLVGRADRTAAELAAGLAADAAANRAGAPPEAAPVAQAAEERPAVRVIAPALIPIPARTP